MHQEQRRRATAALRERGIEQAIFTKPDSTLWLTGFAPPPQVGPPFFAASYPLVWYDGGQFTLIVLDELGDLAASFAQEPDGQVVTYPGRRLDRRIASGAELLSAFRATAALRPQGQIGLEREFTSALILSVLGDHDFIGIDGWLEPLRMVKTDEELVKLRRNFALTEIGLTAARQSVAAGMREIDVWNVVVTAIEAAAGRRLPVGNDCVMGRRAANIGGWPLDYELQTGDSLIVDLSVVADGYWSDSCRTFYVGDRSPQQQRMHQTALDALAFGISLLRPGAVAREIDQQVRRFLVDAGYAEYPHHTGHGIGVSGHEAPRIVAYNDEVLREGMVIMLEPGIYVPGQTSVRIEDAMLITATGAELLTHHEKA